MRRLLNRVRLIHLSAGAAIILFLWMIARFWHPAFGFTALLQFDESHEAGAITEFREYPVYVHPGFAPYDGLQYAQIAFHPLLDPAALRPAVDDLAYRGRRILLPANAWILAAGRPSLIAGIYSGLNIACWLVLALVLWRALPASDWRGFLAWGGVLFSAGALASVRLALIDLPALLLIAIALVRFERGKPRTAAGWLAAAALTRETSLLATGIFIEKPLKTGPAKSVFCICAAAAPLLLWAAYVRWRVGAVDQGGTGNLDWPVAGLVGKWHECLRAVTGSPHSPFAWLTLCTLAGLTAQIVFIAIRPRSGDAWWRVGAAFAVLALVLGPAVWEGDRMSAARVVLPLTLACNLLAARTRAPVAWLLALNLTVPGGFAELKAPNLPAGAAHGSVLAAVRPRQGWYGYESNSHHRWGWSGARAKLEVRTWPQAAPVKVLLTAKLQGITPRRVRVLREGRELWAGEVSPALTGIALLLEIAGGSATLDFESDAPLVAEGPEPGARKLGFAIYDTKLQILL